MEQGQMSKKQNAYAVLQLCLEDPDYDHENLKTDICGHIVTHMGLTDVHDENGRFLWKTIADHIGMLEYEHRLWEILCEDWLTKDAALKKFAKMILDIHGPAESGVPENLRLL
jgi:hypothetical protein